MNSITMMMTMKTGMMMTMIMVHLPLLSLQLELLQSKANLNQSQPRQAGQRDEGRPEEALVNLAAAHQDEGPPPGRLNPKRPQAHHEIAPARTR
jgi:hypothetical protein